MNPITYEHVNIASEYAGKMIHRYLPTSAFMMLFAGEQLWKNRHILIQICKICA